MAKLSLRKKPLTSYEQFILHTLTLSRRAKTLNEVGRNDMANDIMQDLINYGQTTIDKLQLEIGRAHV